MKKVKVDLKNCHGIRELAAVLDFSRAHSTAIYAPNGTMKTSFARTFGEFAAGVVTGDRMFPERSASRTITDENGKQIESSDVVVVLSYDEELGPTEATSTLLVNTDLRIEYENLQKELLNARGELAEALQKQAGTRRDVIKAVSLAFTKEEDNFFVALTRIYDELAAQESAPFADVPYDIAFHDKVLPLLRKPEFRSALSDYVTRLNELLDDSRFFNRESFNYYNASNVTKNLSDNGFFAAHHAVLLRDTDGDAIEVSDKKQLEALINGEKQRISDDPGLRKNLEAVEKALNKNIDTRAFYNYIASHVDLLAEFANIDLFEEKLWKSYLKAHEKLYERVVQCYRTAEDRKGEIESEAAKERTQWERVIDIFNERFFVPFRLTAKNRARVVLGLDKVLELGFDFQDGLGRATVEKNHLLQVLSNGEKKALYILNVLFEVETRKASDRETLFVIDDIADSFDYKNKYAIIQYLKEMSEQENFRLVILTHNFDFFRTLESRNVVGYRNCIMAQKGDERVLLTAASGIRNPFINDFKLRFFDDQMKRVACIPFVRNILEYTKGEDDPDYVTLTSLLHWKPSTTSITNAHLDGIFNRAFTSSGAWKSPQETVAELIVSEARAALNADDGANFENKIVLSIAIRLLAEGHMVNAINDVSVTGSIPANQTHELHKAYKDRDLGSVRERGILDSVVLMTPENIHVNSFMYEPIIDMSDSHLRKLFQDVLKLAHLPDFA